MFIRESKTKNKKTGEVYIKHQLVASVRTDKGPRSKVIMNLGTLTIPRIDWKRLAHALECRITGQETLLDENDAELEALALKLATNHGLSKALTAKKEAAGAASQDGKEGSETKKQCVTIDLNSVKLKETRSIGAEAVCTKVWDLLGLTEILRRLRMSYKSISLCKALVMGRLISPGSERHTIEWFQKRSALREMPGFTNIDNCGHDRFYNAADELYDVKERIEDMLYQRERELFPESAYTIYLYDLTNTYLEGHGLGNKLAARGNCKSKRFDCPLITLGLVVNGDGMPLCSQIYKGNQSEPETMSGIMERLQHRLYGSQLPLVKPTVAMDRGIATADNIEWLIAHGYQYIVIRREDECEDYRDIFETQRDTFELVSSGTSVYGDTNNVYIRKEMCCDIFASHILCISEGKERKERAIAAQKGNVFLDAIASLRGSIQRGTIKNRAKIENKLQGIIDKHGRKSALYDTSLVITDGKVTDISVVNKTVESTPLYGCYVIESSNKELSAQEIWKLYMTLTRVESAFRSMKETLGMRPVFHQKASRTEAHLFITVLAYHLLAVIENLMTSKGDTRTWGTLRGVLSTLVRGTVVMRSKEGVTYNLRISGEPESEHQDIFDKLLIRSLPEPVTSVIDTL